MAWQAVVQREGSSLTAQLMLSSPYDKGAVFGGAGIAGSMISGKWSDRCWEEVGYPGSSMAMFWKPAVAIGQFGSTLPLTRRLLRSPPFQWIKLCEFSAPKETAAKTMLSTHIATQEDQHASGPGASDLLKPVLSSALSFSQLSMVNLTK